MVATGAAVVDRFSLQLTLVLFLSVVVVTLFAALLTAPQRDEIGEFCRRCSAAPARSP